MSELPIRSEAVKAMVARVAELDEATDEFVANVLERESFEEFVAREAAIAFCVAEELAVYDWREKANMAGPVTKQRLCGPWRRTLADGDEAL